MADKPKKTVRVEIMYSQTLHFAGIVNMSMEDYNAVKDLHGDDLHQIQNQNEYGIIRSYVGAPHVIDEEDELMCVQIIKQIGQKFK